MPYASGRTYFDADSHIMELSDFLRDHADPAIRDEIPIITASSGGRMKDAFERMSTRGAHSAERVASLLDLGDGLISGPKGYEALGAFNPGERSTALDMLGFDRQWVFTTFAAGTCFDPHLDHDVAVASTTAHNRAMAEFCADDPRLLGVGATPLDDIDAACAELDRIIELGLAAVWIPHRTAAGRAPGHDDHDRFWAKLADAGLPALLHVGGVNLQLHDTWMNTGREVPTDWLGGGENVRGKDMVALHHAAETFVGTMVLDGVLERHRDLRVGVIELGAGWVPAMLRRLDQIAGIWKRSEPELASLTRLPSEQITQQVGFTPYPFEDVGTLIRASNADLYLFSSDYPHIEGGRDPLARFEGSLGDLDGDVRDRFYHHNMARLIGI